MEWVETTGRTVEEAVEGALELLRVDRSEIEFEVVEDAKVGIFGKTKREARVRARVKPSVPRSKDAGKNRNRRRKDSRPTGQRSSIGNDASLSESDAVEISSERQEGVRRGGTRVSNDQTSYEAIEEDDSASVVEQAGAAQEFLAGLMREFQVPGQIAVDSIEDETISVQITGDANLGLLIGPKGLVMAAVQDLTRAAVQNRFKRANARLHIDIDHFRDRRRSALERFARRVAEEVLATGVQKAMDPMSSADRKVVHDALNEFEGIATRSEGREPKRRVVIAIASSDDIEMAEG
ncbi:MAG: Jag N-terminal domain-containing protein [Actinomycetota bacterium]|nr:Jag N-terminal domain-containing protein [Actinomycetota bacterium]